MSEHQKEITTSTFWQDADDHLVRYRGDFIRRIIVRAKGTYIWDADGKKIIDFTSGQMSSILGHGHPEIAETVKKAFEELDHLFSLFVTRPVVDLATKLAQSLPPGLDKVQLLSTGGESNEAAIKARSSYGSSLQVLTVETQMAKLYTSKFEVVALANSWHGMTSGVRSATFQPDRRGYGPALGVLALPCPDPLRSPFRLASGEFDWKGELDFGWKMIDAQSVGSLACVIVEPILSSGGVLVLPQGYLAELLGHCRKRGMLLIIDEAQTGLGRTGTFCAFERDGIVPDILTLSKTLGAGLPLSAVITSNEIEQVCFSRGYSFYTTHVSDPLPAAVGLKVCEIVERDGLAKRAVVLGDRLRQALRGLLARHKVPGDVRGLGLLIGLELFKDRNTKEADNEKGAELGECLMRLGLSANVTTKVGSQSIFRIAPPLNTSEEEMDEAIEIFDRAFDEVF